MAFGLGQALGAFGGSFVDQLSQNEKDQLARLNNQKAKYELQGMEAFTDLIAPRGPQPPMPGEASVPSGPPAGPPQMPAGPPQAGGMTPMPGPPMGGMPPAAPMAPGGAGPGPAPVQPSTPPAGAGAPAGRPSLPTTAEGLPQMDFPTLMARVQDLRARRPDLPPQAIAAAIQSAVPMLTAQGRIDLARAQMAETARHHRSLEDTAGRRADAYESNVERLSSGTLNPQALMNEVTYFRQYGDVRPGTSQANRAAIVNEASRQDRLERDQPGMQPGGIPELGPPSTTQPPRPGGATAEPPTTVGQGGAGDIQPIPPKAVGGLTGDAIALRAEQFALTGKHITGMAGQRDPVVRAQRAAVENYAVALARSRGISLDELAKIHQTAPQVAKWIVGQDGRVAGSLGTVIDHLDTTQTVLAALHNGDVQTFNRIKNLFAKQFGGAEPTNVEAVARVVGPEIMKALSVANAGTGAERSAQEAIASLSLGPRQAEEGIRTLQELLAGQLRTKQRQAEVIGLDSGRFEKLVGKRGMEVLGAIPGRGSGATPAQGFGDRFGGEGGTAGARKTKTGVQWSID